MILYFPEIRVNLDILLLDHMNEFGLDKKPRKTSDLYRKCMLP